MAGRYRVRDGVRVVVNGTAYSNGAEFDAEPKDVREILMYGWAVPVDGGSTDIEQPADASATVLDPRTVEARPRRTRTKKT